MGTGENMNSSQKGKNGRRQAETCRCRVAAHGWPFFCTAKTQNIDHWKTGCHQQLLGLYVQATLALRWWECLCGRVNSRKSSRVSCRPWQQKDLLSVSFLFIALMNEHTKKSYMQRHDSRSKWWKQRLHAVSNVVVHVDSSSQCNIFLGGRSTATVYLLLNGSIIYTTYWRGLETTTDTIKSRS